MKVTQEIIEYCGLKPSNVEYVDVGNNPNFVFTNDPNFETVILYDVEGNIINVNSWLECAHYVNGGWVENMDAFINEERILFFVLVVSFFVRLVRPARPIRLKTRYLGSWALE